MRKTLILASFACALGMSAQKTFTIASYNVDGLGAIINQDGPAEAGTRAISARIAQEDWDIFGVCEDFKYDNALRSSISDIYDFGTYRAVSAEDYAKMALSFIGSFKADTDGLNVMWKKGYKATEESWTSWNAHKGWIDDQANDCIDKGYRHYAIELAEGNVIDLYHLHMEAGTGTNDDGTINEHSQNAHKQLTQLVNAIKATNNHRPIIVMGDTNCRYTRESMKTLFIDALNADKRFIANDCWVEQCKGGVYPECPSESLHVNDLGYVDGEVVDKIIYINNIDSNVKLTLNNFKVDTGFTKDDGTFLADHCPVVANFTFSTFTDEEKRAAKVQEGNWNWTGEEYTQNSAYYLFNLSRQAFLAKNESTIADINNANVVPWTITITKGKEESGEVKYTDGTTTWNLWWAYRLSQGYKAGINDHNPWTGFGWTSSSKTSIYDGITSYDGKDVKSYAFGYNPALSGYHYLQAQAGGSFASGTTKDATASWLLVSPEQKEAYEQYKEDYAAALDLINKSEELNMPSEVLDELIENTFEEMDYTKVGDFHSFVNNLYYDATITTADYSTLCLPWNACVPADVTVYYGTAFNESGDMISLDELNGNVLPKNTGVVLYSDVDEATTFRFWHTLKAAETTQPTNILLGTNTRIEAADRNQSSNLYYALSNKSKGVGFYEIDETKGVAIPANRAYLEVSKSAAASNAIILSLDENLATGIDNIATDNAEAGIEAIYNAAGIRTNRLQQGVNIIRMSNGAVKKVFVK